MSFPPTSVDEIANLVHGEVTGNPAAQVTGIAPIDRADAGDLSFIAQARFVEHLSKTSATAVLVDQNFEVPPDARPALIRVSNPYFCFIEIVKRFLQVPALAEGVDPSARIGENVRLGPGVAIGPMVVIESGCELAGDVQIGAHCFVGRNTRIGARARLFANVQVAHETLIGKDVIIQYGSVIGSDGFGYVKHEGRYHKIPHLGRVVIEDEVEIGANCCVDRGTFGDTVIRRGAKLDNLIQVAHNVVIGENTVIAAQTGISGSTQIGKEVTIAGQVGFVGHIKVGDNAKLGAQAGVTKSIPAGVTVSGYPAREHAKARRQEAALRRLPELLKRVRALESLLSNGATSREHDSLRRD